MRTGPGENAFLSIFQALDPDTFLQSSHPFHAWQILCLEPDIPLTEEQVQDFLHDLPSFFEQAGPVCSALSPDSDRIYLLLAHTRMTAPIHQCVALWLCVQLLKEVCTFHLEWECNLLVSPLFTESCTQERFLEALNALTDFLTWWDASSAISVPEARSYRSQAQEALRRRRYDHFISCPVRLSARVRDPGPFLVSFVPILMEAVWNQHADISVRTLTEGLSLPLLARRPLETLQSWARSIPDLISKCGSSTESRDMERVISVIQQDPSLPYTLENLARSVGLTAPYFCRLFREQTGKTLSTFLVSTRMTLAQKLLRENSHTLQEIAELCGYPNKSYFCKVFRSFTGMTTGQYEEHVRRQAQFSLPGGTS